MKVKELVEHLKQLDQELEVGVTDHSGDFIPMDTEDFKTDTKSVGSETKILKIDAPYIGEEPD